MQVILLKNVDAVGKIGDVKDVAAGFFRNFLLPRGLAKTATAAGIKEAEVLRARRASQDMKDREGFLKLLESLKNEQFIILRKATPEGHLFGSVSERDIMEFLAGKGYAVPEKHIHLDTHIKELGTFMVGLHFDGETQGTISLAIERGD